MGRTPGCKGEGKLAALLSTDHEPLAHPDPMLSPRGRFMARSLLQSQPEIPRPYRLIASLG